MPNLLDTLRAQLKQMKYGSTFIPTPGNLLQDLTNPNSLRSKDIADQIRGIHEFSQQLDTAKQPVVKVVKRASEEADSLIKFLQQQLRSLVKYARN